MIIIESPLEFIEWRKKQSGTVGFVPTMGALHKGHESLLLESKKQNSISVLSIFVNPTQFNDKKDLEKYPRTLEADLLMAEQALVDVVFLPSFESMYPDNYAFKISESRFSTTLCGAHRPGHFDGVLTVVLKLLSVVNPTNAYFGEKDFQQFTLIKDMVKAFFLPYQIIGLPTLREADGLAMSSRNVRLNSEERKLAPQLFSTLNHSKTATAAVESLNKNGFKVDYVEDINNRRYAAAFLGDTRLIDNVQI